MELSQVAVTWARLWAGQRTDGQRNRNITGQWLLQGGTHFTPEGPRSSVNCVYQPDPTTGVG